MCGDRPLVRWDGHRVIERRSERYLMDGAVPGDVSLTILDLRTEDAGTYSCRVDLPWALDHKQYYILQVRPAEARSSAAPLFTSLPSSTADHMTLRHMTSAHVTSASPQIWTSSSGRRAEVKNRSSSVL
ncbi:unnamed protein product [Knipowitschia caucasica]|uniref:Ig-like domain-containing protein n=1 Tax=Knipowitschia caucasica TaxID=637954 RepID=A0AAV2JA08_KNICA